MHSQWYFKKWLKFNNFHVNKQERLHLIMKKKWKVLLKLYIWYTYSWNLQTSLLKCFRNIFRNIKISMLLRYIQCTHSCLKIKCLPVQNNSIIVWKENDLFINLTFIIKSNYCSFLFFFLILMPTKNCELSMMLLIVSVQVI